MVFPEVDLPQECHHFQFQTESQQGSEMTVAFQAMQLDPYSGSQLWGKWAALNPKLSRNIFKKLVT